jgi:hypothetical protein
LRLPFLLGPPTTTQPIHCPPRVTLSSRERLPASLRHPLTQISPPAAEEKTALILPSPDFSHVESPSTRLERILILRPRQLLSRRRNAFARWDGWLPRFIDQRRLRFGERQPLASPPGLRCQFPAWVPGYVSSQSADLPSMFASQFCEARTVGSTNASSLCAPVAKLSTLHPVQLARLDRWLRRPIHF